MAKPGILPTTAEEPAAGEQATAPTRRRICMAVFSRAKSTSSFRSCLYVLVFLNMMGAMLLVATLANLLAYPNEIADEAQVQLSNSDQQILQYFLIVSIITASFHFFMTFLPVIAEYKESPRLFAPWLGYLYFLVVVNMIGLVHVLATYASSDNGDFRASTHGISFLLLGLTTIISKRRKEELETGMQHAILIES